MTQQAFSAEARLAFWLHATVGFSFGSKSEVEASETPYNLLPASCRLLQACCASQRLGNITHNGLVSGDNDGREACSDD